MAMIESGSRVPFGKSRPVWLRNDLSGHPMELDGFNPSLSLAIEYQGEQHFKRVEYFQNENDFIDQQRRDRLKRDICAANGVLLLEIRAPNSSLRNSVEKAVRKSVDDACVPLYGIIR